jgi:hypothetical protein
VNDRIKAFFDDALARVPVELVSKLDRAEVVRRLQGAVDSEWRFGGGKGVVGKVDEHGFRLRLRIGYRNSFQTHMFGAVQADGRGARIVARTGMHPFAAAFMTLWLSVIAIGVTIGVAGLIQAQPGEPVPALLILVPIGLLAFGVALVGIGRWIARNERALLVEFLARTTEAKAR